MRITFIVVLFFLASFAQAKQIDPVVLIAGDVAQCDSPGALFTAELIKALPYPVLAAGDLAYPNGTLEEFTRCYALCRERLQGRVFRDVELARVGRCFPQDDL